MTKPQFRAIAFLASLVAAASPALAQTQRSGGGEAQKFMQQYQQLAGEKIAAMKKERDALKAHPAGPSPTAVAQLTASRDAAERNVEQSKQRMTELVARFRETAGNLKDVEADRTKLRADLDARNVAFDKCAENNQQLYEINGDLLNRYAHVGLFTKVSAAEPFTQITRTRMDNLVVETRARAEDLRVKKRAP
jgi:hypothetical protein